MTSQLPPGEYRRRMEVIDDLLIDVRMHRAEVCVAHPLCPGRDAAIKVREMPRQDMPDLITSLLAACADRDEKVDNLRAGQVRDAEAFAPLRERIAQLEADLAASRRDADAGWDAYRRASKDYTDTQRGGDPDAQ